jgi:nicotinamidase-related amidase
MAANLGFEVAVISDASATFERTGPDGRHYSADDMHATTLASLHGEFASIVDTQELLD